MLADISRVEHIYVACGYTDMRSGIDGLAMLVERQFQLDPCSNSLEGFTRYLHTDGYAGYNKVEHMLGASAQKVRGRHAVSIYRSCGNAQFGPSWQGLLRPVVRG